VAIKDEDFIEFENDELSIYSSLKYEDIILIDRSRYELEHDKKCLEALEARVQKLKDNI